MVGNTDYPLAESAGRFDGGPYDLWYKKGWDRYVTGKYVGDKDSAYYYFSLMVHLVQDQAVPAHAANIYHAEVLDDTLEPIDLPVIPAWELLKNVPTNTDEFESWTSKSGAAPKIGFDVAKLDNNYLAAYYDKARPEDSLLRDTQINIRNWTSPINGRRYWYENGQAQYKYTGQAFFPNTNFDTRLGWGAYGGVGGTDIYQYTTWQMGIPYSNTASDQIARDQVDIAASYTAGLLIAISSSLPAVVQSPSINGVSGSPATVSPGQSNTISFTLLDNRTPVVTYRLLVDEHDVLSSNDIIPPQSAELIPDNPIPSSLIDTFSKS